MKCTHSIWKINFQRKLENPLTCWVFTVVHNDIDPIYPTPQLGQDMTQRQFSKRSLAGLNSEFSFS